MPSIVIPAHNEAAVIQRCLRYLSNGLVSGIELCVVANACTDRTADLVRQSFPDVVVLETPVPSKTNALNVADDAVRSFPRFYIDADVVVSGETVQHLVRALQEPGILAVSPLVQFDFSGRSWAVRAYCSVWSLLPYCRGGVGGSGVYGLSGEGRRRFGRFPNITADDAFVRLHFAPHERKTVESARSIVSPPKTLAKIIDIKTRSHFGNAELRQRLPHLWKNEDARHLGPLLKLMLNPVWWPALAVYFYVKVATRYRVWQRFRRGEIHKWERDDSSREVPAEAPLK